jgi:hypothetical protein
MFPSRNELNKKWWHRLFRISQWLIVGAITIFGFVLAIVAIDQKPYFILSTEENYSIQKGDELEIKEAKDHWHSEIIERLEQSSVELKIVLPQDAWSRPEFQKGSKLKLTVEKIAESKNPKELISALKSELPEIFVDNTLLRQIKNPELSSLDEYNLEPEDNLFKAIVELYPQLKIKEYSAYEIKWSLVLLGITLGPIMYALLWFIYNKVILYIIYGTRITT